MNDSITYDAIIAAISHPQFKMLWIPPSDRDAIRTAFTECVLSNAAYISAEPEHVGVAQPHPGGPGPGTESTPAEDDYGYAETPVAMNRLNQIELHVASYLVD